MRPCWVADRKGTGLISCRVERMDALIEVSAALPGVVARFGKTGGCARAGPVDRPPVRSTPS
jgi:hypothetical protein